MAGDRELDLATIHVLSNRITRAFESQLDSDHGLSAPEWRVLLSLARHPKSSATDIHELWAMDKMTVSRAVRRLESEGYVKRRKRPDDARSFVLEMTAKGKALFRRILPAANERYREIVSGLSSGELRSFDKILRKLLEHMEDL